MSTDINGLKCMPHIAVERVLLNNQNKSDKQIMNWLNANRELCLKQQNHIAIVSMVFTGMRMDLWEAFLQEKQ